MNFNPRPVEFGARRLPPETLIFGDDKLKKLDEKADWTGDMKFVKHLSPMPLKDWAIFYQKYDEGLAFQFAETIFKVTRSMGIVVNDPTL